MAKKIVNAAHTFEFREEASASLRLVFCKRELIQSLYFVLIRAYGVNWIPNTFATFEAFIPPSETKVSGTINDC